MRAGSSKLDAPNEQTFTLFNLAGPFALIVVGTVASVLIAIVEFLILVNQRLFTWAKRTYRAQEQRILRWRKSVEKKRKERERRRKLRRAQRKMAPVVISPNPYLMLRMYTSCVRAYSHLQLSGTPLHCTRAVQ